MTIPATRSALIVIDLMPRIVSQDMGPHPGGEVLTTELVLARLK